MRTLWRGPETVYYKLMLGGLRGLAPRANVTRRYCTRTGIIPTSVKPPTCFFGTLLGQACPGPDQVRVTALALH